MLFKHKRKTVRQTRANYNYRPDTSLRAEQSKVYQRVSLSLALVIILAVILYIWGIDIVIGISNSWKRIFPNSAIAPVVQTEESPIVPPRIDPIPLFTNKQELDVKGWALSSDEVTIYLNDINVATVLADANGRFEYTGLKLIEGENSVYAKVRFKDKESDGSSVQKIVLDVTKPSVTYSLGEIDTTASVVTISGDVEPNVVVLINSLRVIVRPDGKFEEKINLVEGENEVKIELEDEAGNINQYTEKVTFQKSTPIQ